MSAAVVGSAVDAALTRLEADVDELAGLSLGLATDTEVLDSWLRLERVRRRLDPVEYAVIGEVESRNLGFAQGARNTAGLARQLLHVSGAEAAGRVAAAAAAGPRRALTGEPLGPIYPGVAAAQTAGDISARHARVVVDTVEHLPVQVRAVMDTTVETVLVDYARSHAPDALSGFARELAYCLDQDGQYDQARRVERDRGISLRRDRARGGAGRMEADCTAELAEHLETAFDALARPAAAVDGVADPRSAAQRRHDALLTILKLLERAELMPNAAGVSATIILTMDADTYATAGTTAESDVATSDDATEAAEAAASEEAASDTAAHVGGFGANPADIDALTRTAAALAAGDIAPGSARTGHGYTIPADLAKTWGGFEARLIAVLLSKTKEVTAYSTIHRIFKEQQRLVMIARDGGCSLPGCDVGPQWCEAHHVTEFQYSGRTSVNDGILLCAYHHRHFERMGWTCIMTNGVPEWTPPDWLHPALVPH